ncbi:MULTISPECIES: polysaccharide biosynthesis/export family protein [Duncaniella]|jgi:polysaccharide export outer membrane protein|nr:MULTISPECIES: polysaccharide biosynthesis/export family protein [Duncaniella]NBH91829.1 polysaccharide export protein [Muribaculaceae bacterium S4]NBI20241.1 polysaccharide export protein [Muribaculaceae bacterium Z1]ROS91527.1 polysaccharide export protein [Muribaculaceae bacterium Isolate-039 (Harlan)]ROS95248.1 polysaccharide export protein [Muribaculaceae bacterium Isolate-077 (Janvier)]ROS98298.1 polysaccharide export protein [Muribaculaceae bacterium Isolate-084 (Janvier)]ROT00795.1 
MKAQFAIIGIAMLLAATSCRTSKDSLNYFEDTRATNDIEFNLQDCKIKLEPHDELFISVTSLMPEATAQYNLPLANPAKLGSLQESSQMRQQTYVVDSNGDIRFPMLGQIHVEGMTTEQLAGYLTEEISKEVKDPIVKVELVNFKVSVLGEVRMPGTITIPGERVSILDALGQAQDMTEYGDRSNVLVIREENGKATYHYINLNKSDVMTSPYYFLRQNDVVVVSPNKVRQDNSKYNNNNAYKLQVTSTIVSACSVIASLVIALTVK